MIGEEIVEVSLGLAGLGQVKVGIDGYCLVMVVVVGGVDWSVILCIVWCLEREEGKKVG